MSRSRRFAQPCLYARLRRFAFVSALLTFAFTAGPALACTASGGGVTVCSPTNGSTVTSPVTISAAGSASNPVIAMAIYVDNQLAGKYSGASVDTSIAMTAGNHYVVVQDWDSTGAVSKTPLNITVSDTSISGGSGGTGSTGGTSTCSASAVGVTICSPTAGSTNGSTFTVNGAAMGNNPIVAMAVYLDNNLVTKLSGTSVSAPVSAADGNHYLVVQAWDSTGFVYKTPETINVSSTAASSGGGSSGSGTPTTSGCTASASGVTICAPASGSSVSSPVTINAAATAPNPITAMAIYVDNQLAGKYSGASVDTPVTMSTGNHYVVVQAWDSTGLVYKTPETISVSTTTASGGGGTTSVPGLSNLQHIVFMLQENRSFDNYFGMLGQYRANEGYTDAFDGLPQNVTLPDMSGNPVAPYHYRTECVENTTPSWDESHYDADIVNTDYLSMNSSTSFRMDRFLQTTGSIPSSIDPQGTRAIGYYDWTDLPYYYELATQFATTDRMFSPVMANTVPNRMYLFTGTSWGNAFPADPPSGGFTQKTIFQALDEAGISWRYYYVDNSVYLAQFSIWQKDMSKVYPISSYYNDIQNPSTLPQVIFIERGAVSGLDEHPGSNVQTGAALVAKIMNALMQSPSWASSAFILGFDEAGGLYDHVPPQPAVAPDAIAPILSSSDIPAQFNLTGFRVPFVIASPWAKPHFVSHKVRDLTSILKLIETRFNVPPLTQRDANADDLTEMFDFTTPAWLTPPPLPVQPTNGTCDFQQEKAPGY